MILSTYPYPCHSGGWPSAPSGSPIVGVNLYEDWDWHLDDIFSCYWDLVALKKELLVWRRLFLYQNKDAVVLQTFDEVLWFRPKMIFNYFVPALISNKYVYMHYTFFLEHHDASCAVIKVSHRDVGMWQTELFRIMHRHLFTMVTVMMSAMQRAHHPKKVEIYKHALYWFWFFMIHWSGLCSIYWLIWGGLLGTPYSCLVNAFHWHKRCYWEQWSQVNFNRKIRNKFQWNLNQKSNISIWWNACVANKCQKQGVSLCKSPAGGLNQSWGGQNWD